MAPETAASEDAQRTLERKALRNVRNLVDKLEDEDRRESKTTWRFVGASLAVALAAAIGLYFAMAGSRQHASVVSPAKVTAPNSPGH